MARIDTLSNFLTDVSSAIKQKTGGSSPIPASSFDTEILSITTGGTYQTKSQSITTNGNYIIAPDTGYDAIEQLNLSVLVPTSVLQTKTITENGVVNPDQGYDGFSQVTVHIPAYIVPLYEDLANISNPDTGDYAIVNNSWYDQTIIDSMRTWLNNKYTTQFGQGVRQNNNIILFNRIDRKYYTIYENGNSGQHNWEDNPWNVRISGTDSQHLPRLIDPGYNWLNEILIRRDDDGSYHEFLDTWGVPFPQITSTTPQCDFIIAYADKSVPNLTAGPLLYNGKLYPPDALLYDTTNTSFLSIAVYTYNGSTWVETPAPITITEYDSDMENVNKILYGEEESNV
jgi:hypothetical protein